MKKIAFLINFIIIQTFSLVIFAGCVNTKNATTDFISFSYSNSLQFISEQKTNMINTELMVLNSQEEYYINSTVYLITTLDNKDKNEVLSISINDKKYQSYEFEPGSNSEIIIIKITLGSDVKIENFQLDEVKYVFGSKIESINLKDKSTRLNIKVMDYKFPIKINNDESKQTVLFEDTTQFIPGKMFTQLDIKKLKNMKGSLLRSKFIFTYEILNENIEEINYILNNWISESMNKSWLKNEKDDYYYFIGNNETFLLNEYLNYNTINSDYSPKELRDNLVLSSIINTNSDKIIVLLDPFRIPIAVGNLFSNINLQISIVVECISDEIYLNDIRVLPTLSNSIQLFNFNIQNN